VLGSTPQKTISRSHRQIWESKLVLREVYSDLYRKIVKACGPGKIVEVGGGSGNLKEFAPSVISFDIVPTSWLDCVADAQRLPFASGSIGNLVLFDVLHHIEVPARFLAEAVRALLPGGRIIMVEPAITPLSWVFYSLIHEEPVIMSANPLLDKEPDPQRHPFASNQAIPTLLVTRHKKFLEQRFPVLNIVKQEWLSLLCYPLSGGFKSWSLLPAALVRMLLPFEDAVAPIIGRWIGFRLFVVLEKHG
jgi:SAM-dependent methyltransferase